MTYDIVETGHPPQRSHGDRERSVATAPGIPCAVNASMVLLILMMVLLIASIAGLPTWPYSTRWGYFPTTACGIMVAAMAVLVLAGRL